MTNDRPLGVLSEEFERLWGHIDQRLERTEDMLDRRIAQAEGRVEARIADQAQEIRALTEQVKTTNGRVTALELWKAAVAGALAATGMNWRVLAGVVTTFVAISALAVSIAVAMLQ